MLLPQDRSANDCVVPGDFTVVGLDEQTTSLQCPIASVALAAMACEVCEMRCEKCAVEMVVGFVPDFGTAATWVAVWVSGAPEMTKSIRERLKTGGGVALGEADVKAIDAYRCPQCSRVELYATREAEAGSTPAAR